MSIHELLPAHKIGSFQWGKKLGERVDDMDKVIMTVDEDKWSEHGSFVTVLGSDKLELTTWADDEIYGYIQSALGILIGEDINNHPVVGRKLRYVPD